MCKYLVPGLWSVLWMASVMVVVAAETRRPALELFTEPAGGEGPTAWMAFCEQSQTDANRIYQLRDDLLVIRSGPKGYIRTQGDYTDFVLAFQWLRPPGTKPGAAGVLIRMTGQDKIWPKSLEAQLNADAAGDFWGLDGYRLDGPPERLNRSSNPQFGTLTNLKRIQDAEKPAGQWNQYEITAQGGTVTLRINGQLVNRASGCDAVAGKICLTAEGDEIHFRQVRLTPGGSSQ